MKRKYTIVQDDCDAQKGTWFWAYGDLRKVDGTWLHYVVPLQLYQLIRLGVSEEQLSKCNDEPLIVEFDLG